MIHLNEKAPEVDLLDDQGNRFQLSDRFQLSEVKDEKILLVFYPGDNTPVCTAQLCDYRDGIEEFADLGVRVVGISGDDAASHQKFRQKHDLPFTLLTDPGLKVAQTYGSKGMFGMKRSVFLIDEDGIVRYEHVESLALFRRQSEELLNVIRDLDKTDG
jgi:peroxiredoxin Q/BCP